MLLGSRVEIVCYKARDKLRPHLGSYFPMGFSLLLYGFELFLGKTGTDPEMNHQPTTHHPVHPDPSISHANPPYFILSLHIYGTHTHTYVRAHKS